VGSGVLLKVQTGIVPNAGAIAVVYDSSARAVRVTTFRLGALAWKSYGNTTVTFVNGDKLTGLGERERGGEGLQELRAGRDRHRGRCVVLELAQGRKIGLRTVGASWPCWMTSGEARFPEAPQGRLGLWFSS